jgi:amidase
VDDVIESAIGRLRELGAVIVDPIDFPDDLLQSKAHLQHLIAGAEFKAQITGYLARLGPGFPHSLDELVAKANDPLSAYRSPAEAANLAALDRQALPLDDPRYLTARLQGLAATHAAINSLFMQYRLDAIIYPTLPTPAALLKPAPISWPMRLERKLSRWLNEVRGEPPTTTAGRTPTGSALAFANQTGYPDLTVPAGMTLQGLPVALSFFGPAWSDYRLLGYGYEFEQATRARVLPKYTPQLPSDRLERLTE